MCTPRCLSNQSANIKLIDFGSACMEHNTVYTYIQVLFLSFQFPSDMLCFRMWNFLFQKALGGLLDVVVPLFLLSSPNLHFAFVCTEPLLSITRSPTWAYVSSFQYLARGLLYSFVFFIFVLGCHHFQSLFMQFCPKETQLTLTWSIDTQQPSICGLWDVWQQSFSLVCRCSLPKVHMTFFCSSKRN
jgi:hypothetical protein